MGLFSPQLKVLSDNMELCRFDLILYSKHNQRLSLSVRYAIEPSASLLN